MLVQDPFSGYLHEVPDALAHNGDYGDYGYSNYNGYDEYLDPSVAEYQGELGYFGLPFLAPIISAAASALPQVLPTIASSVINAVTGGGAPPPPPPVQQFAPPSPLLPLVSSVINAVTGGGAPPPPHQAQPMPFMPSPFSSFSSMGGQPPWWRWPTIHSSWINQFRPWRQPPFLSMWRLREPFEQSGPARQMALMHWQQQQGMAPGQMPGMMPGMPYPGMPGYPGQPFPGAAAGGGGGRRRRRRRRR